MAPRRLGPVIARGPPHGDMRNVPMDLQFVSRWLAKLKRIETACAKVKRPAVKVSKRARKDAPKWRLAKLRDSGF